jgi:hypothetical protein
VGERLREGAALTLQRAQAAPRASGGRVVADQVGEQERLLVAADGPVPVPGAHGAQVLAQVAEGRAAEGVVGRVGGDLQAAGVALGRAGKVPQGAAEQAHVAVDCAAVRGGGELALPKQLSFKVPQGLLQLALCLQ